MGLQGAEAILKLRALITTGDFDAYWRFHLRREHERIHHAKYRDRAPCPGGTLLTQLTSEKLGPLSEAPVHEPVHGRPTAISVVAPSVAAGDSSTAIAHLTILAGGNKGRGPLCIAELRKAPG